MYIHSKTFEIGFFFEKKIKHQKTKKENRVPKLVGKEKQK